MLGKTSFGVFDSNCNNFSLLKPPHVYFTEYLNDPDEVISIGRKLVVFCDRFCNNSKSMLVYDVDSHNSSEESLNTKNHFSMSTWFKVSQSNTYQLKMLNLKLHCL